MSGMSKRWATPYLPQPLPAPRFTIDTRIFTHGTCTKNETQAPQSPEHGSVSKPRKKPYHLGMTHTARDLKQNTPVPKSTLQDD